MRKRALAYLAVGLLALTVLLVIVGCHYSAVIGGCAGGLDPMDWVGRAPLTLCMQEADVQMISLCEWDFGDGATDTGRQVTHTYTEVGEYTVRLDVTHTDGHRTTTTERVSVAGEPVADFTWGVYVPSGFLAILFGSGEENELEIAFDASTSYPTVTGGSNYRPTQIRWDFGDGAQETKEILRWSWTTALKTRHVYAQSGVYEVTLRLTDNLGYVDEVTQEVTVGAVDEEPEDEVSVDDFTIVESYWQVTDEEDDPEEECLDIWGSVQNTGSVAAGCEVTATAYDALDNPVGTATNWPAADTNIAVGGTQVFAFFHCSLSVSPAAVSRVEVTVTDVAEW